MSTQTNEYTAESPLIRGLDVSATLGAILFWAILLWWAATQQWSVVRYGTVFVGSIMTVYALDETLTALEEGDWLDAAILIPSSVVLITASLYFALNFQQVYLLRQGFAVEHEYMLARLIIVSLLYLTWREFGNLFFYFVVAVMAYAVFGNYVPGFLGHAGMSELTLLQATVTDLYGFYGNLTQITASKIAPFMLYAGLLFAYGAFDLILRVAIVAAKYVRSGVAQTAVLSSAIIGSINGSYTANAAMTGSFTIPTMIDSGMARHRAAAIESVASTSGQVLPPVMGASAFVMASYLGRPYFDIITAGLVPAAILVVSIAMAVHYTAISDTSDQDLRFESFFEDRLTRSQKWFQAVRFGLPFVLLVYLLGVVQFTVMTSALYTVIAMVITGISMPVINRAIRGSVSEGVQEFRDQFWNTVHGFRRGAIILAPIAIILVVISGVINLFGTTGIPSKIALMLINISGGVLLFAVLLGMVVAIMMGMGMPTVASYVIVAIVITPTFVSAFGVPKLAAHYSMFYAAILAGITPPVATAAVVAAGIAKANFWRTAGASIKIAAPLFVLPVAFVYNTGLVSFDLTVHTLALGLLVMFGAITLNYGLNYPFQTGTGLRFLSRILLVVLGVVVMVYPAWLVKIAGIVVFGAVFVGEKMLYHDLELPFFAGVNQ